MSRGLDAHVGCSLGVTTANVGPLGKYLCASVPAVGVTLWALARVLLRAVVSIACMVWIFKAVLGIDGGTMRKISLYTFVTNFCLVPVTDWGAFIQRVIGRILLAGLLFKLFQLLKQPLFIAALVGVLIWSPTL